MALVPGPPSRPQARGGEACRQSLALRAGCVGWTRLAPGTLPSGTSVCGDPRTGAFSPHCPSLDGWRLGKGFMQDPPDGALLQNTCCALHSSRGQGLCKQVTSRPGPPCHELLRVPPLPGAGGSARLPTHEACSFPVFQAGTGSAKLHQVFLVQVQTRASRGSLGLGSARPRLPESIQTRLCSAGPSPQPALPLLSSHSHSSLGSQAGWGYFLILHKRKQTTPSLSPREG